MPTTPTRFAAAAVSPSATVATASTPRAACSAARWVGARSYRSACWTTPTEDRVPRPMARNPTILLRAFSALLAYPDAELRAALPEIAGAIRASRLIKRRYRDALLVLVDTIRSEERRVGKECRSRWSPYH